MESCSDNQSLVAIYSYFFYIVRCVSNHHCVWSDTVLHLGTTCITRNWRQRELCSQASSTLRQPCLHYITERQVMNLSRQILQLDSVVQSQRRPEMCIAQFQQPSRLRRLKSALRQVSVPAPTRSLQNTHSPMRLARILISIQPTCLLHHRM
jgi:hypothetical protein